MLHPGAPLWFNQLIDAAQFRAVLRAFDLATLQSGARILDVGCGTGRWLRRYEVMGFHPTGIDATLPMLSLARKNRTFSSLVAGESFRLPFADCAFDGVSDITVVQHIPYVSQPQALSEMLRVLKPGGRLCWTELIRGKGAHIFPARAAGLDPSDAFMRSKSNHLVWSRIHAHRSSVRQPRSNPFRPKLQPDDQA